jgi:prepilin-type N-terminal cleavage/methylation domain-containing protein
MKTVNNQKGFTLVEMAIVLVIVPVMIPPTMAGPGLPGGMATDG